MAASWNCRHWLLAVVLAWVSLIVWPGLASADDHNVDDLGLWVPVVLELPVNERVDTWIQLEARANDNLRDISQLRTIAGVDLEVHDKVTLTGFAGWYPDLEPLRSEFRMTQQVAFKQPAGPVDVTLRGRVEERFIEDADDVGVRTRYMLGVTWPIKKSPWYVNTYNELFINLNDVENGPSAGLDQNRLYAGGGRYFGEKRHLSVETGYLLQYDNEPGSVDDMNHIIVTRVYYRLR